MQGLFDNVMDWIGRGGKTSAPGTDVVQAVQSFPVQAVRVQKLADEQARIAREFAAVQTATNGNVPPELWNTFRALNGATVKAVTSLSIYRDELKKAIDEARKSGKLSASDVQTIKDSGLGHLGAIPGVQPSPAAASGVVPFVVFPSSSGASRAAIAATINSWKANNLANAGQAQNAGGGMVNELGSLGIIPLAVIGYGLAAVLAAAVVGGGLLAAYRLTSEDAARGEALRDQAQASLDDWKRRNASSSSPVPMPSIPAASGGTVAQTVRAATPLALLALVGIGGYFLLRKKGR